MANKIVAAFYFVFCSLLFVANVVLANRDNYLACAGVPDGKYIRSGKSCSHYYYCVKEAVAFEEKCPDKYLFSDVKQLCDFAINVNCNSCVQYGRPYHSDPMNCGNYFECVNGFRQNYHCPSNKLFDEISNKCQAAHAVDCKDDGVVPPIDGDDNPTDGSADSEWPMPNGESTRPPPTWGPPVAPNGGENQEYPTDAPEIPTAGTTSRRPGGIGTWNPTDNADAEPTEPSTTTREPWGPPIPPVGGGVADPESVEEE